MLTIAGGIILAVLFLFVILPLVIVAGTVMLVGIWELIRFPFRLLAKALFPWRRTVADVLVMLIVLGMISILMSNYLLRSN